MAKSPENAQKSLRATLDRLGRLQPGERYSLAVGFKHETLRHIIEHMAIPHNLAIEDVVRKIVEDVVEDDIRTHFARAEATKLPKRKRFKEFNSRIG